MTVVFAIFEWLLVLALIGFIAGTGWLVFTALSLKNAAMRDAKRLYEPPLRSVKSLIGTGKGIAQQETVRVRHIAGSAKVAAGAVKETIGEVKIVVEAVHFSDLKPVLTNARNVLKFLSVLSKIRRTAPVTQTPAPDPVG